MILTHEYSNFTSDRYCRKNNKEQWNFVEAKALICSEIKLLLARGWDDSESSRKEGHGLLVGPTAEVFKGACQELKTGGAVGLGQADSPPHNSCTRVPDDKFVPSPLTAVSCVFASLRAGFTKLRVGSFVKMKEMQHPRYLNRAAAVGFRDVSWESEAWLLVSALWQDF